MENEDNSAQLVKKILEEHQKLKDETKQAANDALSRYR
jgi:hypothetical protein